MGFVWATSRTGITKALALCPTLPIGTRGWDAAGTWGPMDPIPTPSATCPNFVLCTVTLVCIPISAKLFCYFLPSWTDKKKNHLQLMYSPNFCTDVDQGDTGPRGDSTAMCFLGTESPLGFLTSFFTKLFHISLGPN